MLAGQSSPHRRWLTRLTTGTTTAALLLLGAPALVAGPGATPPAAERLATLVVPLLEPVSHAKEHPHRKIKKYRVKPGDTPAGVATRFHAWTAQLIAINHTSTLYVGQLIRIPVVVKAARACDRHRHHRTGFHADDKRRDGKHQDKPKRDKKPKPDKPKADKPKKPKKHGPKRHAHRHPDHGWVHANASRADVRQMIVKRAGNLGVNPNLALAISWQEAGWQQDQVSYAGALGAMQVMPGTGRWMSEYVGRRLNLRNLHDNVTAGVVLIKVLRSQAGLKYAVGGYYQGLGGVRRDGMYNSTKAYVANVLAIKKALGRGWNPA